MRNLVIASLLVSAFALVGCTAKENLGTTADGGTGGGPSPLTTLASNQNTPWTIALDADNVYWVNASPLGGVYKVAKSGGAVTTLAQGAYGEITSIGVDATSVYVPLDKAILAIPIGGGSPTTVATTSTDVDSLALANNNLYWTEMNDSFPPSGPPIAQMVPVSGGAPTSFSVPTSVSGEQSPFLTASGGDAVYASFSPGAGFLRLPFDGSAATVVDAEGSMGPMGFDSVNIYFAVSGALAVVPKSGGAPTNLVATQNARSIATDDDFIYIADDTSTGRILKVAKSGGAPTVLADNQGAPIALAIDDFNVYWACANEGTIKKVGK